MKKDTKIALAVAGGVLVVLLLTKKPAAPKKTATVIAGNPVSDNTLNKVLSGAGSILSGWFGGSNRTNVPSPVAASGNDGFNADLAMEQQFDEMI